MGRKDRGGSVGTPATVALTRAGIPYAVRAYEHDPAAESFGLEAAEALGVEPARVLKTLLVDTGNGLAVGIVPVDRLYVDANYKEGQLQKVRIGQRATLTSDLHGGDVVYHGRVVGLAGGTGSAFALIPAQNATGNWIKVVQRVPVRIAIDSKELQAHPLRLGQSMKAVIHTGA